MKLLDWIVCCLYNGQIACSHVIELRMNPIGENDTFLEMACKLIYIKYGKPLWMIQRLHPYGFYP